MASSAKATRPTDLIVFAHNSERQFARLLDFYRVDWEYEPTAFPIEWDSAGNPVQYFRPDFYLPGFDLYIEITTLNQRLVTRKNRKVRRLRELYPQVRIKVLYQRDYLSLLAKYGLERPSQMSGRDAPEGPREQRAPRDAAATAPAPPAAAQGGAAGESRGGAAGAAHGGAAGEAPGGAARVRAAGRPRALPDPPEPPPPLPADPELVRLAAVPLPAELERRAAAGTKRAG
jgi:hypothetical protein